MRCWPQYAVISRHPRGEHHVRPRQYVCGCTGSKWLSLAFYGEANAAIVVSMQCIHPILSRSVLHRCQTKVCSECSASRCTRSMLATSHTSITPPPTTLNTRACKKQAYNSNLLDVAGQCANCKFQTLPRFSRKHAKPTVHKGHNPTQPFLGTINEFCCQPLSLHG
jgi:hypothetical protein